MHDGQMLFDSTITWNKQEWMVDETVSSLLNNKIIQAGLISLIMVFCCLLLWTETLFYEEKALKCLHNEVCKVFKNKKF